MQNKKLILVTDQFNHESFLTLSQQPFLHVMRTESPVLDRVDLNQVNGLIIRSRTQITQQIFERAKNLQVIISATSGFDHIDLKAAEKWGVTIMHTPMANVESAAQLTWTLILNCAHQFLNLNRALRSGEWKKQEHMGLELHGKVLGIAGLGRIGTRVAEIAEAFGMKLIAYDPYIDEQAFRDASCERVAYEELLKRSDILTYHVPKTSETKHMLNRSHFEYINRDLILINASRGSVINENDLIESLDRGWIGAVGLDVFEKEPLSRNTRLLSFPNVTLTPHVGAYTHEAFAKASEDAALKLAHFFLDGSTSDTLPPKAAWYGAVQPWNNSPESP